MLDGLGELLGLIGSIPLGAVGTFVVARRISYLAAAIAHSVLGGIGGNTENIRGQ